MPKGAFGVFEPEGLSIWINEEHQADLNQKNTGVLSHEFTHYVHSLSTVHSIDDLISLIFFVHAGIQRLEDLSVPVALPLTLWSEREDCPTEVKNYVRGVEARNFRILNSFGFGLDPTPSATVSRGSLYTKKAGLFIKTSPSTGVPVARQTLMEGAALAKKCEALGDDSDLKAKQSDLRLSHYFAVHDCCLQANPNIDPLKASALVCDLSLCSLFPSQVFELAIAELADRSPSSTLEDFEARLLLVYDKECRAWMSSRLAALEKTRATLPANHRTDEELSWAEVLLRNAIAAVSLRQKTPFSLIKPLYLGLELFDLAAAIGSPVILTNDMRLTSLASTPESVHARNAVRTLSYICRWLLEEEGPLQCPYSGCPVAR